MNWLKRLSFGIFKLITVGRAYSKHIGKYQIIIEWMYCSIDEDIKLGLDYTNIHAWDSKTEPKFHMNGFYSFDLNLVILNFTLNIEHNNYSKHEKDER